MISAEKLIAAIVAAAPPLTDDQRRRIGAILQPAALQGTRTDRANLGRAA